MQVIASKLEGYPSPLGRVILARVLTADGVGQVAVYVGVLTDTGKEPLKSDLEWIGHHGSKLTEREAGRYFELSRHTFPLGADRHEL